MSTAEATYVCETCGTEVRHTGGSHPPRWCAKHRAAGRRTDTRKREQRRRAKGLPAAPPKGLNLTCSRCHTTLLRPDPSGMCGFCIEEQAQVPLGAGSICQETPKRATYAGTTDS